MTNTRAVADGDPAGGERQLHRAHDRAAPQVDLGDLLLVAQQRPRRALVEDDIRGDAGEADPRGDGVGARVDQRKPVAPDREAMDRRRGAPLRRRSPR